MEPSRSGRVASGALDGVLERWIWWVIKCFNFFQFRPCFLVTHSSEARRGSKQPRVKSNLYQYSFREDVALICHDSGRRRVPNVFVPGLPDHLMAASRAFFINALLPRFFLSWSRLLMFQLKRASIFQVMIPSSQTFGSLVIEAFAFKEIPTWHGMDWHGSLQFSSPRLSAPYFLSACLIECLQMID